MCLVLLAALTGGLHPRLAAQEKPKPPAPADPIAADLDKAKADFQAAAEKAKAALVEAFGREEKKATDSPRLKPDERIKLIESLQAQKAAFEDRGTLPTAAAMATPLRAYRTALAAARKACEKAFDAAADGYVRKKELGAAKDVLAEKARHFDGMPDFEAEARRDYWVYDFPDRKEKDLWFRAQGKGEWVERSGAGGGTVHRFRETARTADYVELYDKARQVGARLYADRAEMRERDGAGWKFLANGNWQTPGK